jgi:dGTPase
MAAATPPDPDERRSGTNTTDVQLRPPARRDRDRILYSDSFRRLGGVTQTALGDASLQMHNRLTHSLKVEQVGTSLHGMLAHKVPGFDRNADRDAIEAACLGHDIGHPPFGHAGEAELHKILTCKDHRETPRPMQDRIAHPCGECLLEDGFEGNAQSFRILAVLAVHRDPAPDQPYGLDLTRGTLAAVSKYPWTLGAPGKKSNKWGAYDCDAEILEWVFGKIDNNPNLAAQVMDWSDDISYAVHDLEDFYRSGRIPLDQYSRLAQNENTDGYNTFLTYVESALKKTVTSETREALRSYSFFFPRSKFQGRADELAALDRMRNRFLTAFMDAAQINADTVKIDLVPLEVNSVLKQFTWFYVINDPGLNLIQLGQKRVLREIFDDILPLLEDVYKGGTTTTPSPRDLQRLPNALRRAVERGQLQQKLRATPVYDERKTLIRGLIDYISGLSDTEAYRVHAVLRGGEAYALLQ